jgi:hypothetical protein
VLTRRRLDACFADLDPDRDARMRTMHAYTGDVPTNLPV